MSKFYVYCMLDPETRQPFYVGKGTNRRMYEHWRVRSRLRNPLLKNKLLALEHRGLHPVYEKVIVNVDEEQAFLWERELIAKHGRKIDNTGCLCNLTEGGEGNSSTWTEERKQAQSATMKGKRGFLPIVKRAVCQYTLQGDLVTTFTSVKQAAEQVPSANASYITQCCKGKRVSSGGFLWAYKGDPVPTYTKKYYKQVDQRTVDGELVATHQSLTHAQQATGIELHCISEACRGKSKTAGGFVWQYNQHSSR